MDVVVQADAVVKRWGATTALAGTTFTMGRGVTGLVGANGAGKTTLLGLVLGMHRPDGGRLEVLGRDPWTGGADLRARLGYAPEHDALPADVSAHEIVRHVAEIHGLPRRAATERASEALFEVGLGEERFRLVGTFSTGQRQRAKLAQAIAHDPRLVLLDEPTSGLDPVQREEMLGLVRRVGHELGIDVILSSHLLEEVERVCDAVVILDHGTTVASGGMASLRGAVPELIVELDEPPDGARTLVDALAAAGAASAAMDGGSTVVVALEGDVVHDLVRDALAATGLAVRSIQRATASLEDVYLRSSEAAPPRLPRP